MPSDDLEKLRDIRPRTKVWLERDGRYVFGHGISRILKAVAETGSIKEAAGRIGKSYRHIWTRIKEAERNLQIPLVETRVGGTDSNRSRLTAKARELIEAFDAMRSDVIELVQSRFGDGIA